MTMNHNYNLHPLEQFFKEVAPPEVIICHLDDLLQTLVYYGEHQKVLGIYETYLDIYLFKQALSELTTG